MSNSAVAVSAAPRRGWKPWGVAAAVLALLVAAVAAGWYAGGGKYKWSEPYRAALRRIAAHPQVVQRLGEPIRDASWLPSGTLTEGERGQANLMFRVAGPQGIADVHLQARQVGGIWGGTVSVNFGPGDRVQLELEEAGQGEAPRFEAAGQAPTAGTASGLPKVVPPASSPPGPTEIHIDIPPSP